MNYQMDLSPTYHRNVFILCCVVFLINCYHDDGLTLQCPIIFTSCFSVKKKFVTICPGDMGGGCEVRGVEHQEDDACL